MQCEDLDTFSLQQQILVLRLHEMRLSVLFGCGEDAICRVCGEQCVVYELQHLEPSALGSLFLVVFEFGFCFLEESVLHALQFLFHNF